MKENDWLSEDQKYVWHPFTQMQTADEPLVIKKAKGVYLYDAQNKSYIDANSSWWVNVHGHSHPHIGKAIQAQFESLDHVIFAGVTHPKGIELAKRILGLLPDHFKKVFFSDDGSTAVEVALKMAIQYFYNQNQHRPRILAIDGAYHGDTFGAMSVGQRDYFNRPFEPYFFEVDFLDFPLKEKEDEILKEAETKLKSEEFALLIVEPLIQGSAGMRTYSVDFLEKLVALAKKYGTLVVFDEVMTGWGRTGKMFAMNHGQFKPDIVCLSKGLTGGVLPLGLTVATQAIYDAFLSEEKAKALLHGHSFTGNALSCAAACASIDLFEQEQTWNQIAMIVEENKRIVGSFEQLSAVKEVRNIGTIFAIELHDQQSNYFSTIRDEAYRYFLSEGILMRPLGNVLFINPPYCISKQELNEIYNKMIRFVKNYTLHYES